MRRLSVCIVSFRFSSCELFEKAFVKAAIRLTLAASRRGVYVGRRLEYLRS